ncbi:hypothetical protein AK830_g1662 [Neonectria ditissima]|uniref:Bacteriocin-protection protein n=1 Tax=Neonectria ditissima TaxID=78410 RepID=A0A0P7BWP1_9HYPO|nr:hypothetical protein AK830_g1662 [Neonectria ditissima]
MSRQTRSASRKTTRPRPSPAPTVSEPSQTPTSQLFEDASAWESWLEDNHQSQTGIWLRLSKKGSRVATVSYDEALDIALCYGWIDGQRKSFDDKHFIQRYTPRRKTSIWSKRNVNKVAALIESGRMKPSGQAEIDAAQADGRWERAYSGSSNAQVPADFQDALNGNKPARDFFESLTRTQRYPFIFRLETAKRPDTRLRRIEQFVALLADEKGL